ncbi:MAG: cell division protein SepF [Lachnospiraceae bacterium]|nr:cell division protein SepF [Lachnospiraceae bacterium]
MSIFDPFLEKMKLNDDDDEYMFEEEETDDDDDEVETPPVKRQPAPKKRKQREVYRDEDEEEERQERPARAPRPARSNIVSMRSASSKNSGMEVCLIKPTSFDDGREICDTLLSGRSVVINLEGIPTEIAQRIIDFTSGACYSMDGNLQKISNYIVIVTPRSVELTGDFNDMISPDGIDISNSNY